MRILIYGLNFAPEMTGIGKYSGEMADWFERRGHDVRVVTAQPYYPDWKVLAGYRAGAYSVDRRFRFPVWRCPLWVPAKPRAGTRLLHLMSFALSSIPVLLAQVFWKPQVVISVMPTLFSAPSALVVARLCGATACLHIQDFEIEAAFGLGILNNKRAKKLMNGIEGWLYSRFDCVSTISPRMRDKLLEKGVEERRAVLFPNWVDCDVIRPLQGPNSYRREHGVPEATVVLMYSGAMGEKQGIEVVLDAARKLSQRKDVVFVLAGAGSARQRAEAMSKDLANVLWFPLQPTEKLNEWLNFADIHLMPQRSGAADLVMPSKLTGMLASGRPVVAIAEPGTQLAEVVEKVGKVASSDSSDAFTQALVELIDDPSLRKRLGEEARRFALDNLDRSSALKRFEANFTAQVGRS